MLCRHYAAISAGQYILLGPPIHRLGNDFSFSPEPTTVKTISLMFPDFVSVIALMRNKPLPVHGCGQYVDPEKTENAGLVIPPPMESTLASYG